MSEALPANVRIYAMFYSVRKSGQWPAYIKILLITAFSFWNETLQEIIFMEQNKNLEQKD